MGFKTTFVAILGLVLIFLENNLSKSEIHILVAGVYKELFVGNSLHKLFLNNISDDEEKQDVALVFTAHV